jgi:SAM-dependent methyltransferase
MSEPQSIDLDSYRNFEQKGWGEVASGYSDYHAAVTAQAADALLDAVAAGPGMEILDVACGPGVVAAAAAARSAKAVGIDFAESMIAEAKRRYPDVVFKPDDAESLSFDDSTFNAVVCNFGMLHFAEPDKAIAEAFRVLRPGGHYAFTVWQTPDKVQYLGVVTGAVMAHGNLDVDVPAAPPPFRFSEPEEAKRTLTSRGFADITTGEVTCYAKGTVDELIGSLYSGTVRSKALAEAQTPEARKKIHAAIEENAKPFTKDGIVTLAMPAIVASGRKP